MRRVLYILLLLTVGVAIFSCKRRPSYVLGKEDMAQLMADIHVGESVVDMNAMEYTTDSSRLALRQAILEHHGVSQADFDTSLVWYAHNFQKYLDVYDRTIEILEARNRALGNAIIQSAVSISGDSAEVWPGSRYAFIDRRMPSRTISFDIDSDANWMPGDVYTWRMKIIDEGVRTVRWTMLADYSDSTYELISSTTSSRDWNELVFPTDSTKTLSSMCGYFEIIPLNPRQDEKINKDKTIWIDSISLVRKRANPEFYRYRTRIHNYKKY